MIKKKRPKNREFLWINRDLLWIYILIKIFFYLCIIVLLLLDNKEEVKNIKEISFNEGYESAVSDIIFFVERDGKVKIEGDETYILIIKQKSSGNFELDMSGYEKNKTFNN